MDTKKLRTFACCDLKNEDIPKSLRLALRAIIGAIETVDEACYGILEHDDIMPIQSLSVAADFKLDMIAYMAKLSTVAICNLYEKTKVTKSNKEVK